MGSSVGLGWLVRLQSLRASPVALLSWLGSQAPAGPASLCSTCSVIGRQDGQAWTHGAQGSAGEQRTRLRRAQRPFHWILSTQTSRKSSARLPAGRPLPPSSELSSHTAGGTRHECNEGPRRRPPAIHLPARLCEGPFPGPGVVGSPPSRTPSCKPSRLHLTLMTTPDAPHPGLARPVSPVSTSCSQEPRLIAVHGEVEETGQRESEREGRERERLSAERRREAHTARLYVCVFVFLSVHTLVCVCTQVLKMGRFR